MGSKISCLRKNEEEEIIADRNILEKIAEENKNQKSESLSWFELECILFHFEIRKRRELCRYYPKFEYFEKRCLFNFDSLEIENRKVLGNVTEKDNNIKSRNVSLLGLECILLYFETSKRLELSLFYPGFRILEKQCPLTTDYFYISSSEINFDMARYEFDFKNCRRTTTTVNNNPIIVYANLGVLQFILKLFAGRSRFRVRLLDLRFVLPFKLSIDCDTVHVDSTYLNGSRAVYYSNVFRKIKRMLIFDLRSLDDLNYPWIQNVNIVEVFSSDLIYFLPALPNIPAEAIIVDFQLTAGQFDDLIRVWCESRNGRVGCRLFMIFSDIHRDFRSELESRCLSEIGFIAESNERWRLPMNNKFEAILSIREDYESFRKRYSIRLLGLREYLCLEVVNLYRPN